MYTYEIINLVNSQNGNLTIEQLENILAYSQQVVGIVMDGKTEYEYSFWTNDKYEPIYFNISPTD